MNLFPNEVALTGSGGFKLIFPEACSTQDTSHRPAPPRPSSPTDISPPWSSGPQSPVTLGSYTLVLPQFRGLTAFWAHHFPP
jgi:hypothetical protein